MHSLKQTIGELFTGKAFIIPDFSRAYSQRLGEVNELIDKLLVHSRSSGELFRSLS